MAFLAKHLLFIWVASVLVGVSMGETYNVGDEAGWTAGKNVSYEDWAASKIFHVGDVILFTYNKTSEDVLLVSKAHYRSCDPSKPLAKYSSGNDSVTFRKKTHFFFISGVADHCQHGMKLHIRVLSSAPPSSPPAKSPSSPALAPVPAKAPSASPSAQTPAPTPSPSGSSSLSTDPWSMSLLWLLAFTVLYHKWV